MATQRLIHAGVSNKQKDTQIMNRIAFNLLFLIAFYTMIACGYKKINDIPPPPPPPPPSVEDTLATRKYYEDQKCRFIDKQSVESRRQIYPFNSAESVWLVSFSPVIAYIDDTTYMDVGGIPKHKGKIDYSKFTETIVLSDSQIDSLTNILYNIQSNLEYYLISHLACDCPCENAILFMNKREKCFAYIGLCFQDQDFFCFPENTEVGEFCDGKYELLMNYFRSAGIKRGID